MKTAYLTLSDLFTVFKKNMLLILVLALVLGAAGGLTRAILPADYATEVTFYVRNPQGKDYLDSYGLTSSQLAVVQTLAKEYAGLVKKSGTFHAQLIQKHGLPVDEKTMAGMIDAAPDNTTFRVTVTGKDPAVVRNVAAALSAETADWLNRTAWPYLYEEFSCVTLLQAPAEPTRSSAHPFVVALVSALVGALLGYVIAMGLFLFGPFCRDGEELQRALPAVPLLGVLASEDPDEICLLRGNLLAATEEISHPVLALIGTGAPVNVLVESLSAAGRSALLLKGEALPAALSLDAALPAADLLASPAAGKALAALAADHDLTVLDMTDLPASVTLAPAASVSGYLLAVTPGHTRHRALKKALAAIEQAGGKPMGMIIAK